MSEGRCFLLWRSGASSIWTSRPTLPGVYFNPVASYHKFSYSSQSLHIVMAARPPIRRCLLRARQGIQPFRCLHTTPCRRTDGVFRELTDQRVQIPWIDAFRKKEKYGQEATRPSGKPETPSDRDLTPKKMSDSYHSVAVSYTHLTLPTKRIV